MSGRNEMKCTINFNAGDGLILSMKLLGREGGSGGSGGSGGRERRRDKYLEYRLSSKPKPFFNLIEQFPKIEMNG